MKTEAKSVSIKSPLRALGARLAERDRAGGNQAQGNLTVGGPLGGSLQALASELNQSATQGTFQYPRNWLMISKVAAVLLLGLAVASVVQVARPLFLAAQAHLPVEASGVSVGRLAGVAFGVLFAITLAAVLTNLFPVVRVAPQGLGISELVGWRRVRWDQVGVLKVMELEGDRYVVMVPIKGATRPRTPAPVMRLIPWLAGSGRGERGLVITSDMVNFDRMLQLMVLYMAEAAGQGLPRVELFVDESATLPFAQLVLQPEQAVVRLTRRQAASEAYGAADDNTEPQVLWKRALPRQVLLALPPAVLMLLNALLYESPAPTWPHLFMAVGLLALGVGELLFMAKLIQTVGDLMVGSGQFARATAAYQELQMPRVVMLSIGAILVGLGLPVSVAEACWLAGIALTSWLTVRFVQKLYYVSIPQTLIAAVGGIIYQLALLALFFSAA